MSTRVNMPIIGKAIDRTEDLVITGDGQNLKTGEIFVANKFKVPLVLAAADTIADTDTIYIGLGLADTITYALPDGTAVTEKRISWSNPIQGSTVRGWSGISGGTTAIEAVVTLDTSGITPVAGTEYVVRVVYEDILTHPGQFTQTFRHTATAVTAATATTLVTALKKEINKAGVSGTPESRVLASGTDDLVLTGIVIPNNETNDEIDEYSQVDFEVASWSITAAGVKTTGLEGASVAKGTLAKPGIGNAKLVRDKEKMARGYAGVTNTINFPVIKATMLTDMSVWYDVLVIEHDTVYESGETQYLQSTPITTEIYIPTGTDQSVPTAGVEATIIALNAWMASLPMKFATVTV